MRTEGWKIIEIPFSRHFYPKRLTVMNTYVSYVWARWEAPNQRSWYCKCHTLPTEPHDSSSSGGCVHTVYKERCPLSVKELWEQWPHLEKARPLLTSNMTSADLITQQLSTDHSACHHIYIYIHDPIHTTTIRDMVHTTCQTVSLRVPLHLSYSLSAVYIFEIHTQHFAVNINAQLM